MECYYALSEISAILYSSYWSSIFPHKRQPRHLGKVSFTSDLMEDFLENFFGGNKLPKLFPWQTFPPHTGIT